MAYQYDTMGNVIGEYESEEERQKRLEEANQEVQTTQVKTYGDGSQEHTVKTQVAAPVNPAEVPATQPTSTNPTYGKMLQVESGNRDFYANGAPITSSAGAMYAGQVLPSTAQNPGFGITPAGNQSPEEYNRVGKEYFDAMLKKYGGNNDLAAAAYHSGPGNVDKALQQSQQSGQDWRSYLGPQGQSYVQKVGGYSPQQQQQAPAGQPAYLPEAGQFPPSSVNPQNLQGEQPAQQQPSPIYSLSNAQNGLGIKGPNGQPMSGAQPNTGAEQQQFQTLSNQLSANINDPASKFINIQENIDDLMKFRMDPNMPDYLKQRATDTIYEQMSTQRYIDKANQKLQGMIQSGDNLGISKVMTSTPKDDEGSWLKMLVYGFISPQLAASEAVKLGIAPTKWEDGTITDENGKMQGVQLQRRADGKIMGGTHSDGTPLTTDEISTAQSGSMTGAHTSQTLGFDNAGNTISHTVLKNGRIQWKDETNNKILTKAPEGYHTGKNQQEAMSLQAYQRSRANDEAANRANNKRGLAPLYTQEEIESRATNEKNRIMGIQTTTYGTPSNAAPAATSNAAPAATSNAAPAETPPVASTVGKPTLQNVITSNAQAIANYESPPLTGSGVSGQNAITMAEVYKLNPGYDGAKYKIMAKTRQDFTTGKQGQAVQSMNVAVDHLDSLSEATKALKNGQLPLFNKIANEYSKNTGSPLVTNFDSLKSIVGSEVAKAVAGGATALGDREEIRKEINAAGSEQQLLGAINKYQQLMAGQVKGLKQTYESAGLKGFDDKLLPRTKRVLNEVSEPTRSKW